MNRRVAAAGISSRPIVLVAYGGGHVAMLEPVARALREAGRSVLFLALTTAGAYLERLGIEYIGYRHLPEANAPEVQARGGQLAGDLSAGGPVPREETIAYLGLNYLELVAEHGADGAAALYAQRGRQAFRPVGLFERWLASVKPALVVATNSPRSEQAALLAAGRLGLRALCAVDIFGLQEVQWIGQPGYADRICVLNEDVRDFFVAYGRKPDEVVVTGNPAFERLTTPAAIEAGQRLRFSRGWDDGSRVILWASQVEPEQHPFAARRGDPSLPRRIEAHLREFVAAQPGYRLVVRYHPSERQAFVDGQERVEFSPTGEDLAALLHAVDLVVVTSSTVGLEAKLAGRPVISVDASVFTDDAPYSRMGISTGVPSPAELAPALLKLSVPSREVSQPPQAAAKASGGPTQNLVRVIDSLMA